MKLKWIIFLIAGFGIVSFGLVLRFGMGPKPIRVLDPSVFENQSALAAQIAYRFYNELKNESEIYLELSDDPRQDDFWKSFYDTSSSLVGRKINVVATNANAKARILAICSNCNVVVADPSNLLNSLDKMELNFIFTASGEIVKMHLQSPNPFTLSWRYLDASDPSDADINACQASEIKSLNENARTCATNAIRRRLNRKKLDKNKVIAALEKYSPVEQLLYVFIPPN